MSSSSTDKDNNDDDDNNLLDRIVAFGWGKLQYPEACWFNLKSKLKCLLKKHQGQHLYLVSRKLYLHPTGRDPDPRMPNSSLLYFTIEVLVVNPSHSIGNSKLCWARPDQNEVHMKDIGLDWIEHTDPTYDGRVFVLSKASDASSSSSSSSSSPSDESSSTALPELNDKLRNHNSWNMFAPILTVEDWSNITSIVRIISGSLTDRHSAQYPGAPDHISKYINRHELNSELYPADFFMYGDHDNTVYEARHGREPYRAPTSPKHPQKKDPPRSAGGKIERDDYDPADLLAKHHVNTSPLAQVPGGRGRAKNHSVRSTADATQESRSNTSTSEVEPTGTSTGTNDKSNDTTEETTGDSSNLMFDSGTLMARHRLLTTRSETCLAASSRNSDNQSHGSQDTSSEPDDDRFDFGGDADEEDDVPAPLNSDNPSHGNRDTGSEQSVDDRFDSNACEEDGSYGDDADDDEDDAEEEAEEEDGMHYTRSKNTMQAVQQPKKHRKNGRQVKKERDNAGSGADFVKRKELKELGIATTSGDHSTCVPDSLTTIDAFLSNRKPNASLFRKALDNNGEYVKNKDWIPFMENQGYNVKLLIDREARNLRLMFLNDQDCFSIHVTGSHPNAGEGFGHTVTFLGPKKVMLDNTPRSQGVIIDDEDRAVISRTTKNGKKKANKKAMELLYKLMPKKCTNLEVTRIYKITKKDPVEEARKAEEAARKAEEAARLAAEEAAKKEEDRKARKKAKSKRKRQEKRQRYKEEREEQQHASAKRQKIEEQGNKRPALTDITNQN